MIPTFPSIKTEIRRFEKTTTIEMSCYYRVESKIEGRWYLSLASREITIDNDGKEIENCVNLNKTFLELVYTAMHLSKPNPISDLWKLDKDQDEEELRMKKIHFELTGQAT